MIGANITVTENSELVRQGLQNLAADIPQIGRLGIFRTAQRIVKRMKTPGAPISYPVHWDSDLQRRAFFASDGFGRGIPSGRGGIYESGWQLVSLSNGYEITNDTPYALYIAGDELGGGQSSIHEGRWGLFSEAINDEIGNLDEDVSAEIRVATLAYGFSPGL